MGHQRHDGSRDHRRPPVQPEEREHRHHGAQPGTEARRQGRLDGVLATLGAPELLGHQHLEQALPAPGQLVGQFVGLLLAEPLELVVEGYLLPLLLGVLLDLPALLFDVGVGDLGRSARGIGCRAGRYRAQESRSLVHGAASRGALPPISG